MFIGPIFTGNPSSEDARFSTNFFCEVPISIAVAYLPSQKHLQDLVEFARGYFGVIAAFSLWLVSFCHIGLFSDQAAIWAATDKGSSRDLGVFGVLYLHGTIFLRGFFVPGHGRAL